MFSLPKSYSVPFVVLYDRYSMFLFMKNSYLWNCFLTHIFVSERRSFGFS